MGDDEKMFYFSSRFNSLVVKLVPDKVSVVGTEVIREPGYLAEFTNGIWATSDPTMADKMREVMKRDKNIIEITEEDRSLFEKKPEANPNIRDVVTQGELKNRPRQVVLTEAPTEFKCEVCGEEFKTKRQLDTHKLVHRAGVQSETEKE